MSISDIPLITLGVAPSLYFYCQKSLQFLLNASVVGSIFLLFPSRVLQQVVK